MGASVDEEDRSDFAKAGNVTIGAIAGDEARLATEREHSLSLLEAVKLYPTAVGWSIYFSLGVRIESTRERYVVICADVGAFLGYHGKVCRLAIQVEVMDDGERFSDTSTVSILSF